MTHDQDDTSADLEAHYAFMMRHFYAPFQRVETEANAEELTRLLARVETTWRAFGETEPHWSVITSDKFRQDSLESQMSHFLEMGRENVDRVAAVMARQGLDFSQIKTVIDYGCGVGRVSAAYAARGCQVTGVDISSAHLKEARTYFDKAGIEGADFIQLHEIAQIDDLPQVDLVYSLIVLQHNPPPVIAAVLRRLLRRVKEGGVTYFQLPTYKAGYAYRVAEDLEGPEGHMEMHVLPQPVLFQILKEEGFSLLEVAEDASCWDGIFRSQVILAQKAAQPPALPPEAPGERVHETAAAPAPPPPRKGLLSRLNARRKAARRKTKG